MEGIFVAVKAQMLQMEETAFRKKISDKVEGVP